jgi:hypothetical protein
MIPRSPFAVKRLAGNPILHRETTLGVGTNINGPSLIAAPEWLEQPLGKYYLYFAHHRGTFIRLAVADQLEGPWRVHQPGTLQLAESHFPTDGRRPHIASPDVHVDADSSTVRMYYHGLDTATREQHTRVALSRDGVHFEAQPEILGRPYFRVFQHDGWWYALGMPGIFYRSKDGLTDFERGPKLFPNTMRHSALLLRDGELNVFWSNVGDTPERILCSKIALEGDWHDWQAGPALEVIAPEESWEGAEEPLRPSVRGWADAPVNELRDPAIFEEGGRTYLLYSVAGESGIAIGELLSAQAQKLTGGLNRLRKFADPGLERLRQASVSMVAVLGAFLTSLLLKHAEHLSTSVEVLAVALSLTLGRITQRPEHRSPRGRALALVMLPVVALISSEIGSTIFHHPDLGDTLFVLGMTASIYLRRFGDLGRRIGTLATLPLVALLITPAPVVALHGGGAGSDRLWSAAISIVALAWVAVVSTVAERIGWIAPAEEAPRPPRLPTRTRTADGRRRIAASTKMALQMGVSLGAAFAIGRTAFGMHWTWVVLTAFIVNSGNRGREDVAHKAVMRLIGAGGGTLAASLVASAFPAGDAWSIVCLFAVLSVAVWLRPLNYAFWAAGMTAALALLYGYYGEHGISLLATRLEGIAIGACIGVAASWILLPVRSTDIIRRDVAIALVTLDRYLAALVDEPDAVKKSAEHFRAAVHAFEHHATLLRNIPGPLRSRIDHLPAIDALAVCAERLPGEPAGDIGALQAQIGELRAANARKELPDRDAWSQLATGLEDLGAGQTPAAPPIDRLRVSTERVLAYVNRAHGTDYRILAKLEGDGAYALEDATGGHAELVWSPDKSSDLPGLTGRTPSGYPYALST